MLSGIVEIVWMCVIILGLNERFGMKWLFMMLTCMVLVVDIVLMLCCMFMKLVFRMLGLMCVVMDLF